MEDEAAIKRLEKDIKYYSEKTENTQFCLNEDKEKLKFLKEDLRNKKRF